MKESFTISANGNKFEVGEFDNIDEIIEFLERKGISEVTVSQNKWEEKLSVANLYIIEGFYREMEIDDEILAAVVDDYYLYDAYKVLLRGFDIFYDSDDLFNDIISILGISSDNRLIPYIDRQMIIDDYSDGIIELPSGRFLRLEE